MSWIDNLNGPIVDSATGIDLSPVLALGNVIAQGAVTSAERKQSQTDVEMLETEPQRVTEEALKVAAFIDGIQASFTLTYREHRPVLLAHIAAGAAIHAETDTPDLAGLVERVSLVASIADQPWLSEISDVPAHYVDAVIPPEVEHATRTWVGTTREECERQLTQSILQSGAELVGLDGHLVNRTYDERLFGIVKSNMTRYLPDESVLYSLRQGHRSPIFKITSTSPHRYSCYVRMQPNENVPWSHGLIRLESFNPNLLPALCATALSYRQGTTSSDTRWDRHLVPIRVAEQLLRSRRPSLFSQ